MNLLTSWIFVLLLVFSVSIPAVESSSGDTTTTTQPSSDDGTGGEDEEPDCE